MKKYLALSLFCIAINICSADINLDANQSLILPHIQSVERQVTTEYEIYIANLDEENNNDMIWVRLDKELNKKFCVRRCNNPKNTEILDMSYFDFIKWQYKTKNG